MLFTESTYSEILFSTKKKKTITTTYSEFLIIPYFSPNILAISHYNLSDILPKDSNKTFCNVYKKLATYSCRIQ